MVGALSPDNAVALQPSRALAAAAAAAAEPPPHDHSRPAWARIGAAAALPLRPHVGDIAVPLELEHIQRWGSLCGHIHLLRLHMQFWLGDVSGVLVGAMILCICTLNCQYKSTQHDAPNMASRDAKTILTPTSGYRKVLFWKHMGDLHTDRVAGV